MAGGQTGQQMQGEKSLPGRAKYWSECTEEEKCERLREQVRNAQSRVAELERQVFHLVRHQHGEGGMVMTPVLAQPQAIVGQGGTWGPSDPSAVYF